jgi:hypothetical protein
MGTDGSGSGAIVKGAGSVVVRQFVTGGCARPQAPSMSAAPSTSTDLRLARFHPIVRRAVSPTMLI